ncbi:hypothetical protein [Microbacterium sp. 1.5R]|uniref:hypothetical protein n=1 Tax=Microbacterium sp. 1.5R TaxID=1916917 RepID=UPI0011A13AD0|nr:hypothetical protein [Microbacterium sp. 1.5R]
MTRTRKILLIGAAVVVIAVVALVIWMVASQTSRPDGSATPAPSTSVPPTPTVFPTPTPGATDGAPSDEPPVEVPIDEPATVVEGVTAQVVSMEAFESSSEQPGDLAGPALRVLLRVTNSTAEPIDLGGASVNLASGEDANPAPPLGDTVATGLPASLAPGESAEGQYSFSIPLDARADVTVTLDLLTGEPYVAFRGAAPAS